MASNTTPFKPLDGMSPEEEQWYKDHPNWIDETPSASPTPTATATPKPEATKKPRPQSSVPPSVSNTTPTGIIKGPQFAPTIKMQPLGIGAGRSLPYPVGQPGVNVFKPATGGKIQPILTSDPKKSTGTITLKNKLPGNTVPLFGKGVPATRGRMPRVLPGQQKSVTSNTGVNNTPGGTGDSKNVNRTSLPNK